MWNAGARITDVAMIYSKWRYKIKNTNGRTTFYEPFSELVPEQEFAPNSVYHCIDYSLQYCTVVAKGQLFHCKEQVIFFFVLRKAKVWKIISSSEPILRMNFKHGFVFLSLRLEGNFKNWTFWSNQGLVVMSASSAKKEGSMAKAKLKQNAATGFVLLLLFIYGWYF